MKFKQILVSISVFVAVACASPVNKTQTVTSNQKSAAPTIEAGVAGVPSPLTPPSSQSPSTLPTSSAEPVLTTQDAAVIIGTQEVVTSDSGVVVKFTITPKEGQEFPKDGVHVAVDPAKLGLANGEQPLLYRVRGDQFGQAELVGAGQTATRTTQGLPVISFLVPVIGDFLFSGSEKFPFINDVLEAIPALDTVKYGIFSIDGNGVIGSAPAGQDQSPMILKLGSYVRGRPTWTRDETFPVKVNVFIHHGSGSDHRSAPYSFSEWVKYNTAQSPRKGELAATVRGYYLDRWNTRLSPDAGAEKFNTNRTTQFDPGTPWIHVCHSAGCNEATRVWSEENGVYVDNGGYMRYNDLGRIELAPARGGSQLETPDIIYATISRLRLSPLLSAAYLLSLRDAGQLAIADKAPIAELLTGKPLTLLNENGRALAWSGRGVGFPVNMTYQWFALGDVTFPYFQKRITEAAKFRVTPCGSDVPASLQYTDLRTGECFYNYAEKLDFLEDWYAPEGVGARDVIAGFVPTVDPKTIEKAEETILSLKSLRYAFPGSWDTAFKEKFERDALPLGCFLIAKSPSLTSNDPLPNENILCDCAVGVVQQLNLKNGRSILRSGSTYTNFDFDRGAAQERLPLSVRKFEVLKMNHIDAATGSPQTWDLMDQWLLERTQKLRDEEDNLVITDEDKRIFRQVFIPDGNKDWLGFDYQADLGRNGRRKVYYFYPGVFTYTQNPLGTKQKNRVRVKSSGSTTIGLEGWDSYLGEYREYGAESERWSINRDFIKRNGRWHLVRLPGE